MSKSTSGQIRNEFKEKIEILDWGGLERWMDGWIDKKIVWIDRIDIAREPFSVVLVIYGFTHACALPSRY